MKVILRVNCLQESPKKLKGYEVTRQALTIGSLCRFFYQILQLLDTFDR